MGRTTGGTVALAVGAGVVAAGLFAAAVYRFGPSYGLYVVPPTPARYAAVALGHLDRGLYAHGTAWQEARAQVERAARTARTYDDLHDVLAEAAEVAGGRHSFLVTPDAAREQSQAAAERPATPTVTTDGGVTTLVVPAVSGTTPEQDEVYARALADGIAAAAPGTCGWVVDLRGNTGGTMYPMLAGVSPLLPDGTAFEMVGPDGTAVPTTIRPDGVAVGMSSTTVGVREKVVGAPVAVLQDGRTGSSGEAVLASFRGLPGVRSFGAPSAGFTSANSTHRLYDGALLMVTQAVFVDRDGVDLAEEPIVPDVEVVPADAPAAARAWFTEQGCP